MRVELYVTIILVTKQQSEGRAQLYKWIYDTIDYNTGVKESYVLSLTINLVVLGMFYNTLVYLFLFLSLLIFAQHKS